MTGQRVPGAWPPLLAVLGIAVTQVIGWGTTLYLPAMLGQAMAFELSVAPSWIFGGVSVMMMVGAALSPRIGSVLDRRGAAWVMARGSPCMAAGLAALSCASGIGRYLAA